jgi:hypothetical protein
VKRLSPSHPDQVVRGQLGEADKNLAQGLKAQKNNTLHSLLYCFSLQEPNGYPYADVVRPVQVPRSNISKIRFLEPLTDVSCRMFNKLQRRAAGEMQDPRWLFASVGSHPFG